ncbi:MAG: hypothetical protein AB1656_17075 [Candidatus Omnitrophota bacterium]
MSDSPINHSDPDLEFLQKWIDSVRGDVPEEEQWQAAHSRLRKMIQGGRRTPSLAKEKSFRLSLPRRWAFAALFAALILTFILGFNLGSYKRGMVFADVLEKMQTVRTYACDVVIEGPGGFPVSMRQIYNGQGRMRVIRYDDFFPNWNRTNREPQMEISIIDSQSRQILHMLPFLKRAAIFDYSSQPSQESNINFVEEMRLLQDGAEEVLDIGVTDGQAAVCFRVRKDDETTTVWANVETGLPVRVVKEVNGMQGFAMVMPGLAGPNPHGHPLKAENVKIAFSNFEFNPVLNESLFSLDPPEGYNLVKISLPYPAPAD